MLVAVPACSRPARGVIATSSRFSMQVHLACWPLRLQPCCAQGGEGVRRWEGHAEGEQKGGTRQTCCWLQHPAVTVCGWCRPLDGLTRWLPARHRTSDLAAVHNAALCGWCRLAGRCCSGCTRASQSWPPPPTDTPFLAAVHDQSTPLEGQGAARAAHAVDGAARRRRRRRRRCGGRRAGGAGAPPPLCYRAAGARQPWRRGVVRDRSDNVMWNVMLDVCGAQKITYTSLTSCRSPPRAPRRRSCPTRPATAAGGSTGARPRAP